MIGRVLLACTLVASVAVLPAEAQERRPKGQDYSEKKICKVEGRAGSRLGGKRSCKTQAEWDEAAREARLAIQHIQAGPQPCLMAPNDPTIVGGPAAICGGN